MSQKCRRLKAFNGIGLLCNRLGIHRQMLKIEAYEGLRVITSWLAMDRDINQAAGRFAITSRANQWLISGLNWVLHERSN
jgi:3-methyladenine DNA glycosylase Mpg